MKRVVTYLMVFISLLCSYVTVSAEKNLPETVKIGLYWGNSALSAVNISCDGDIIVYYDGQEVLRHTNLDLSVKDNKIYIASTSQELYVCDDKELKFAKTDGYIKVNGKPYRGSLQIINLKNGKMTVINKVNLEEYLYGVVSLEMSTGFPIEALKSQAVCARTYAVNNVGYFANQGFDMVNTTLSQVYGGVSVEKEDCTRAVDETKGMLVTYQDKPALVFYSATSSGHTLNVKDVWGSQYPYLIGVDDSYQQKVKPGNEPWKVPYTKEEFKEKLKANGVDIGDIIDVEIIETSPEGAVTKLKFIGTNGEKIFEREKTRTLLNLKSQVYTIEKTSQPIYVITSDGVKQAYLPVAIRWVDEELAKMSKMTMLSDNGTSEFQPTYSDEYTLVGSGNGHGIGMSQNGAKAMAMEGFTYTQILTHYFTGTEIK